MSDNTNINFDIEELLPLEIPKKHINYSELAHLGVNLAYKTDNINRYAGEALKIDGTKLIGSSWHILASSCDKPTTSAYGYKAVAFINEDTKRIHIASAGTKADINDIWDDALITFNYTPNKLPVAQEFITEIINKIGGIEEAKNYTFGTSGHSLGAIIADLTAVELHSRNLNFDKSITFDSPGSREIIKYAIDQKLFTGEVTTPIEKLAECAEIYNATPNIINTTNYHLGAIKEVLPQIKADIEQESLQTSGLWGWGQYLYDTLGLVAQKSAEYLGITKLAEQINNHKLHNFADLETAAILPIADWREQILENNNDISRFKDIKSTGDDVFLLEESRIIEDYGSLVYIDKSAWSYSDLQQSCAMEVDKIGDINHNYTLIY